MQEKYYSTNNEEFSYSCPEDAAEEIWSWGEHKVGDEIVIYEGESVGFSASGLLPDISEYMMERAYDEVGEYSDIWDFSKEASKELQQLVEKVVDDWADKNNMQPNFYSVVNVKEIKVKFIKEDGEIEIVNE